MAFQNCFTENQQTIKELLWKRKQIQGSEKQQVVPYISPAEQLPSTRKVCKETLATFIIIKDLAKSKSGAPDYNKLTWLEPAIQLKTSYWTVVNFKKHATSISSKPEPVTWSHDTGQQIP